MDWLNATLRSLVGFLDQTHTELYGSASAALGRLTQDLAAAPIAIALAFALGMVHALMPGHGKMVVFSYFLGNGARLAVGIGMAFKIALLHVATALLLILVIGASVVRFGRLQGVGRALEIASFVAVAAIGGWLLWRALARRFGAGANDHRHHGGLLGYAVGLLPCPLTIILMNYALVNETVMGGVLLVAVMALGIGTTMSLTGLAAILARRAVMTGADAMPAWFDRAGNVLEIAGAVLILAIGLGQLAALLA
jgi:ABC-type nickel/cobalt efflux system permease component RcnA